MYAVFWCPTAPAPFCWTQLDLGTAPTIYSALNTVTASWATQLLIIANRINENGSKREWERQIERERDWYAAAAFTSEAVIKVLNCFLCSSCTGGNIKLHELMVFWESTFSHRLILSLVTKCNIFIVVVDWCAAVTNEKVVAVLLL